MKKIFEGILHKMKTTANVPVQYSLLNQDGDIVMNSLIGHAIHIAYQGTIHCVYCNAITRQSFHNGYCYSCFTSLPETDRAVLHPEEDKSHLGISRDMEWSKQYSLIDHIVYVAVTGNVKVGVTRHNQIPTRWIDQGAMAAIKLARTPYRQLAGLIEVELKKYVADKTKLGEMLSTQTHLIDLQARKNELAELLPPELKQYVTVDNQVVELVYPIQEAFKYLKNLKLDKTPDFLGRLIGIKGQYLMFEDGTAFNVRNHSGYVVVIEKD